MRPARLSLPWRAKHPNSSTITIPGLPMGLDVQSVTMTQQGILVHITGHNVTLSGNS